MNIFKSIIFYFLIIPGVFASDKAFDVFYDVKPESPIFDRRCTIKPRDKAFFAEKYQKGQTVVDFFTTSFAPLEGENCQNCLDVYYHTKEEDCQAFEKLLRALFKKSLWHLDFKMGDVHVHHLPLSRETILINAVMESFHSMAQSQGLASAMMAHDTVLKNLCQDHEVFMYVTYDQYHKYRSISHGDKGNDRQVVQSMFEKIPNPLYPCLNLWDFVFEMKRSQKYPEVQCEEITTTLGHTLKFPSFYHSADRSFPSNKELNLGDVLPAVLRKLIYSQGDIGAYDALYYLSAKDFHRFVECVRKKLPTALIQGMDDQSFKNALFKIHLPVGKDPFNIEVSLNDLRFMQNHVAELGDGKIRDACYKRIFALPRSLTPDQYGTVLVLLAMRDREIMSADGLRTLREEALGCFMNRDPHFFQNLPHNHALKQQDGVKIFQAFKEKRDSKKKNRKKKRKTPQGKPQDTKAPVKTENTRESKGKRPAEETNLPFEARGKQIITPGVDGSTLDNTGDWNRVPMKQKPQKKKSGKTVDATPAPPILPASSEAKTKVRKKIEDPENYVPLSLKAKHTTPGTSFLHAAAPEKRERKLYDPKENDTKKEKKEKSVSRVKILKRVVKNVVSAGKDRVTDDKEEINQDVRHPGYVERTLAFLGHDQEKIRHYVQNTQKMVQGSDYWRDLSWANEKNGLLFERHAMLCDLEMGKEAYQKLYADWYKADQKWIEEQGKRAEAERKAEKQEKVINALRKDLKKERREKKEIFKKNQEYLGDLYKNHREIESLQEDIFTLKEENDSMRAEIQQLRQLLLERENT